MPIQPYLMFDGRCEEAVRDAAEANRLFAALGDGGKVTMPIGKTFFPAG